MTAATGVPWRGFRDMIRAQYTDLVVIGGRFSADTGMDEIIISCRKLGEDEKSSGRGIFVSLDEPPESVLEGMCAGLAIWESDARQLEDRPHGGTRVMVGGDEIGTVMDCPIDTDWPVVGISNHVLPQVAYHIRRGKLYSPPTFIPADIRTIPLYEIAEVGPSHLQIRGGDPQQGRSTSYSGPFNIVEWRPGCLYPALWNNDSHAQQQMEVSPDCALEPRPRSDSTMVKRVWGTASHLHMNLDARTTSQCLMASYTEKPVVGGTAWPSIIAPEPLQKGLAVWCNCTLGILVRWAMSNHGQPGRSRSSRTAIRDLPVPEAAALERLGSIYDEFATRRLDRIMNLWRDDVRIAMDNAVLEVLGLEADLDYIRKHLCAEPTMNGGKMPTHLEDILAF